MDDKQTVESVEELLESLRVMGYAVRNIKAATEFLQDVADLK